MKFWQKSNNFSFQILKNKIEDWQSPPLNPVLGIAFLVVFSVGVALCLAGTYKRSGISRFITGGIPAMSVAKNDGASDKAKNTASAILPFSSLEDFKNYLDDGARAYVAVSSGGGGETEESFDAAGQAREYLSLGMSAGTSGADIIDFSGKKIYFSPPNQYYLPASVKNRNLTGVTMIFDAADPEETVQIGTIPRDGNFFIAQDILAVFLDDSLAAYDVSKGGSSEKLWQGKLESGSEIVAAESQGSKLFLVAKTAVGLADSCPIKPMTISGDSLVIDCAQIYHPEETIFADSVFTVIKVDLLTGKILDRLSFVGQREGAALINENGVYAFWRRDREQVSFFNKFLQTKCKSLLPNYLLEKVAVLPEAPISLAGKEFELRQLFENWFLSLSETEKERVADEILNRLREYLRDGDNVFEQTVVSKINLEEFEFAGQAQISGYLPDRNFVSVFEDNLRILTVSGRDAEQKMEWFVRGSDSGQGGRENPTNAYSLTRDLDLVSVQQKMDLPVRACAARFTDRTAYLITCRAEDPVYAVDLNKSSFGLRGHLEFSSPAYIYAADKEFLLVVSQEGRKIKIEFFDAALPARIKKISEYELNDYWSDFDANRQAFSVDDSGKRFFLPVATGGYVFSLTAGQIELQKVLQGVNAARAKFFGGDLVVAGTKGLEIFSGQDWRKLKSIKF